MLDGKPFKLRADLQIPWKRGQETGFHTLDEIKRAGMMGRDYSTRMHEFKTERAAFAASQDEWNREKVRQETRFKALERDTEMWRDARSDPTGEKWTKYLEHRELYAADENYRNAFDRSIDADVADAEKAYEVQAKSQVISGNIASDAAEYITSLAEKFAGVDPNRVTKQYVEAWKEAAAEQDPARKQRYIAYLKSPKSVDDLYTAAHEEASRLTAPLTSQLESLKQELAALKAAQQASEHNDRTRAAINGSRTSTPGRPASGVPVGESPKPGSPDLGSLSRAELEARRERYKLTGSPT